MVLQGGEGGREGDAGGEGCGVVQGCGCVEDYWGLVGRLKMGTEVGRRT